MISKSLLLALCILLALAAFFPDCAESFLLAPLQIAVTRWFLQTTTATAALLLFLLWLRLLKRKKKNIFFDKNTTKLPIDMNNKGHVTTFHLTLCSCLIFVVFLFLSSPLYVDAAPHMVSIAKDGVNMRQGPGTRYGVKWELDKGYPLMVLQTKNDWYHVRDFEGDTGWVYKALTTRTAHVIVKKPKINIRSRPGTGNPVVAKAYRGVVLETIASVKGWVKVRHEKGLSGWVARNLVWGW